MDDLKRYLVNTESAASLAERIGITPGFVSQWINGVRQIPLHRCIQIEKATDGAVRCEQMRPDIDWSILRKQPA